MAAESSAASGARDDLDGIGDSNRKRRRSDSAVATAGAMAEADSGAGGHDAASRRVQLQAAPALPSKRQRKGTAGVKQQTIAASQQQLLLLQPPQQSIRFLAPPRLLPWQSWEEWADGAADVAALVTLRSTACHAAQNRAQAAANAPDGSVNDSGSCHDRKNSVGGLSAAGGASSCAVRASSIAVASSVTAAAEATETQSLLRRVEDLIGRIVQRLSIWSARGQGRLPLCVDVTLQLLQLLPPSLFLSAPAGALSFPDATAATAVSASQFGLTSLGASPALTRFARSGAAAAALPQRLALSLLLQRLVNGLADAGQTRAYASSVASLAAKTGLPRAFVDLRHEAAHGALPSLPVLSAAGLAALDWLWSHYWSRQASLLHQMYDLTLPTLPSACPSGQARPCDGGGSRPNATDHETADSAPAEAGGSVAYWLHQFATAWHSQTLCCGSDAATADSDSDHSEAIPSCNQQCALPLVAVATHSAASAAVTMEVCDVLRQDGESDAKGSPTHGNAAAVRGASLLLRASSSKHTARAKPRSRKHPGSHTARDSAGVDADDASHSRAVAFDAARLKAFMSAYNALNVSLAPSPREGATGEGLHVRGGVDGNSGAFVGAPTIDGAQWALSASISLPAGADTAAAHVVATTISAMSNSSQRYQWLRTAVITPLVRHLLVPSPCANHVEGRRVARTAATASACIRHWAPLLLLLHRSVPAFIPLLVRHLVLSLSPQQQWHEPTIDQEHSISNDFYRFQWLSFLLSRQWAAIAGRWELAIVDGGETTAGGAMRRNGGNAVGALPDGKIFALAATNWSAPVVSAMQSPAPLTALLAPPAGTASESPHADSAADMDVDASIYLALRAVVRDVGVTRLHPQVRDLLHSASMLRHVPRCRADDNREIADSGEARRPSALADSADGAECSRRHAQAKSAVACPAPLASELDLDAMERLLMQLPASATEGSAAATASSVSSTADAPRGPIASVASTWKPPRWRIG